MDNDAEVPDNVQRVPEVPGAVQRAPEVPGDVQRAPEVPDDVQRAHRAETLLQGISETIPGFVWAADPTGKLDFSTNSWVRFSGGMPGQSLGDGWVAFLHPDDLLGARTAWSHAIAQGTAYDTRFRLRRADGVYRWFLVRATPLRDASGAIIRWAGINVDVDEQVQAEMALQEMNATLEHRVAQAVAEREQLEAALRQSQKMEAIGQLTGGIAHDFNNMLQGVIGNLDLIRRRIEQGRANEVGRLLTLAAQGADRAAALTAQLLSFARRQSLTPRLIDPSAIVTGMAELVRQTAGPSVVVVLDTMPGLQVRCDVSGLESAVLNLAINARDAMPRGGQLRLSVRMVAMQAADLAGHEGMLPGEYVRIAVADTGIGMTPDVALRAFEPFFTTKPVGRGTGLGLSQIYGFVRQSGGVVALDSVPGRGTEVVVLLPCAPDADGVPHGAPGHGSEAIEGGLGLILLVEDEEIIRGLATEALEEAGWQVLPAHDGASALALVPGRQPALLIIDVGLPAGLNGRQVAEALRAQWPGLPVLFITGLAEQLMAADRLPPSVAVLAKPFTLKELVERAGALALNATGS